MLARANKKKVESWNCFRAAEFDDDERLHDLLVRYRTETDSMRAWTILEHWREERMRFVRIETSEYQRVRDELRNG